MCVLLSREKSDEKPVQKISLQREREGGRECVIRKRFFIEKTSEGECIREIESFDNI